MAMATSAIAACACAHHQPQKAEKNVLSCHSSSHESESLEISNDDPNRLRLGEQCSCYLDRTQTAIVAKSEQKKFKTQPSDVAANVSSIEISQQVAAVLTVTADHTDLKFHPKILPGSGPPRAPPRL
jgi:hypothetical protein